MPYILLAAVVLSLWGLHYYPHWIEHFKGKDIDAPIRRQSNYVTGILGIFTWFTVWMIGDGSVRQAVMMWIFITVGGLTVFGMYQHDANVNNKRGLREEKERTALLEKQRHAPKDRTG